MKLTYPAIFEPYEDGPGYVVTVPDLPGCVTEGDSMDDAIYMAKDAASGWVLDELEDGKPVPIASKSSEIQLEPGQFLQFITFEL